MTWNFAKKAMDNITSVMVTALLLLVMFYGWALWWLAVAAGIFFAWFLGGAIVVGLVQGVREARRSEFHRECNEWYNNRYKKGV